MHLKKYTKPQNAENGRKMNERKLKGDEMGYQVNKSKSDPRSPGQLAKLGWVDFAG